MNNDTNLNWSGFESEEPMMHNEIFTIKLCMLRIPPDFI